MKRKRRTTQMDRSRLFSFTERLCQVPIISGSSLSLMPPNLRPKSQETSKKVLTRSNASSDGLNMVILRCMLMLLKSGTISLERPGTSQMRKCSPWTQCHGFKTAYSSRPKRVESTLSLIRLMKRLLTSCAVFNQFWKFTGVTSNSISTFLLMKD